MLQSDGPLADGSYDVPRGSLAAVVTHLVCHRAMAPRPRPPGVMLWRDTRAEAHTYRDLFRLVGRDWLWTSRLMLEDDALLSIILDPDVELHILEEDGERIGMVELDVRQADTPRIAFFGLAPGSTGRGIGPWLMSEAQRILFDRGAPAIRLDTCSLDSPQAMRFYLSCGFTAERREVRLFPDPRALGILDTQAAPSVPLL